MKTNKLDNNIKERFKNRTLAPSVSAWERLSAQLDEQPQKKKRGWFFYIGYVASILIIVSIGIQLFSSDKEIMPKQEFVIEAIDKEFFDTPLEKLKNPLPVEKAIVKTEAVEHKTNNIILKKEEILKLKIDFKHNDNIMIAKLAEKNSVVISPKDTFKNNAVMLKNTAPFKRTIKINATDLLYAVTHSQKEVETYYAKYNVTRDDVLNTIKSELKKSNLKVNPNTILAEVERTIHNDNFENNFLKSLKKRISNIATAIASRND